MTATVTAPVWQDVSTEQTKIEDIKVGDCISRHCDLIMPLIRADQPEKVLQWFGFWEVVKIRPGTYEDGQPFIDLQGAGPDEIYRRYPGKLITKVTEGQPS